MGPVKREKLKKPWILLKRPLFCEKKIVLRERSSHIIGRGGEGSTKETGRWSPYCGIIAVIIVYFIYICYSEQRHFKAFTKKFPEHVLGMSITDI